MKKFLFFIPVLFLLTACPRPHCGNCETTDFGTIPDEVLNLLPYINGTSYSFKHVAGQIVSFDATRETRTVYYGREECCPEAIKSEENTISLAPDYPIFSINMQISKWDEDHYNLTGSISNSGTFVLPNPADDFGYEQLNTLSIGTHTYNDVYKVPVQPFEQVAVYVDTLYYNKTKGILKISLSNDEYYEIEE